MLWGKVRGARDGVEPILEAERTVGANDLGFGVKEGFERLKIPLVDRTGVTLQEPPQFFVVVHSTATGLTGHPVPRAIRSGPMANRNSQRSARAHCSAKRESATLSIRWRPMAVIPI